MRLRNPTVRLRYLAARRALHDHDQKGLYLNLLRLLGCAESHRQTVQRHLSQLAVTFDQATTVSQTPFFFSTDITQAARPIAIDGSQHLIDTGDHREAVFWIIATYARCMSQLRPLLAISTTFRLTGQPYPPIAAARWLMP